MSIISTYTDRVRDQFNGFVNRVRKQAFGANNERLDFLMDSFYKLSPQERTGVLVGVIAAIGLLVLGAVAIYITQVNRLQSDLDDSFAALHELQAQKKEYFLQEQRFNHLMDSVGAKTRNVRLKPLFEKIAKEQNTQIEGLNETKGQIPADNPLAKRLQEVRLDMRFPNISIPRLLNFLIETEKSNSFLRIQDLSIRGRYGTRLFFDAQANVRGYSVGE